MLKKAIIWSLALGVSIALAPMVSSADIKQPTFKAQTFLVDDSNDDTNTDSANLNEDDNSMSSDSDDSSTMTNDNDNNSDDTLSSDATE